MICPNIPPGKQLFNEHTHLVSITELSWSSCIYVLDRLELG